jgi:hypothetical protein
MFCSPLLTFFILCLAFFIPYPKMSISPINLIFNILQGFLLYYLCKIGWVRLAWAIVLIPLIIVLLTREEFDKFARSEEERVNKK